MTLSVRKSRLVQIPYKPPILERHNGRSKVGILQCQPHRLGHRIPIDNLERGAWRIRKLQLVVRRRLGKVLDLRAVAARQRTGRDLELAVAAGAAAQHLGVVGGLRVVDPDDDVLPVVAVRARADVFDQLVFGEVPCVHDARLAGRVLADPCVDLSFASVAAFCGCAA